MLSRLCRLMFVVAGIFKAKTSKSDAFGLTINPGFLKWSRLGNKKIFCVSTVETVNGA